MKRRIIYFTVMLFTAVLCFSCSDMLAELNGKNKAGATNGEPLSIKLTAGKPQKNGDSGQKLSVTVTVTTDSEVKKVVWKKGGTEIAKKLLADESAAEATATDDNKKWTFEITATNETDGNGTYTVAVLDGAGRREAEQISITNQFDFTNPPKPDGTKINVDYPSPTDDTSIKLTWSEPDETAEPNYDHAEITLTYTQDDGNGGTKTSDPVSITVNKGTTEYTFTDLTDDKKKDYTVTIKYVDTTGNESEPCSVTVTKYALTYQTDGTGANTATKTVLVKDGEKLKANQLPPALPDTSDHYFAGWYDSKDNTKTLIKEGSTLAGDVTLAPKWECGISYDKGGHGTEQKEARFDEGTKITVSQLPVPEPTESEKKDGWKFAGWYLDSSCSDEKKVPDNYEVTKNTTLYAKWIQQKGRTLTESVRVLDKDVYKGTAGEATDKIIYIEFGDWPQTIKADEVTVDKQTTKQQGMFTYCLGSDGEWYVKQAEKAFKSDYTYSKKTTVGQNGQSEKWFKVEPIKWRVLTKEFDHDGDNDENDKQWLLLAENILVSGIPYYDYYNVYREIDGKVSTNNYEHSRIRAYLNGYKYVYKESETSEQETNYEYETNGGFLKSAFTEMAQKSIGETEVDNSAASTNPELNSTLWNFGANPNASDKKTKDRIYLLSTKEATTANYGFEVYDSSGKGNTRIRLPTDYARATGAYDYSENGSGESGYGVWWWLRSPYYNYSDYARLVNFAGNANGINEVDDTIVGIVPALSISAQ